MQTPLDGKVGLGFRPALAGDLLRAPAVVDFVEVVAEACAADPAARREACALAELWPVVPHGVKLSLGSADGIDVERARRLGALARDLRAPVITEHAAFTSAAGHEIGHLTQLPRTRAAVAALARNVAVARRFLPAPLLLENVAWTWRGPDDEMSEGDFYAEVCAATGCGLLLDLGNLRANALNEGRDPLAVLAGYPLEHVAMVHIAGGVAGGDGFFYDNHAAPVPDGVFDLLAALVRRVGPRPVLLERDAAFPPFAALQGELARARAIAATASHPTAAPTAAAVGWTPPAAATTSPATSPTATATAATTTALAQAQAALARRLTAPTLDDVSVEERPALARARGVLGRKRIEDALPLLPHLQRRPPEPGLDAITAAIATTPRPPRGVAPADALQIATAALAVPALADDARRDLLLLRARFVPGEDGALRSRALPFLGAVRSPQGGLLIAARGAGARAAVRCMHLRWPRRATTTTKIATQNTTKAPTPAAPKATTKAPTPAAP